MRIGLDAREAWRMEPRGIGVYIRHLMQEFGTQDAGAVARDVEVLLYHQLDLPPGTIEIGPNLRSVRADVRGDRMHAWERLAMPWRMRRDRVDVYHGTYNTLPPRWRLWPGPPMVVTMHDAIVTWWPDDGADEFVRYARAVTPRVVRDAALILTVSDWSKNDICTRFSCDPQKVRMIRNGLSPDFLAGAPAGAADAARTRWAEGRPYLFSPGAPLARKNTGRLLEAFALLLRQRPDLPFLLLVSGLGRHVDRFRALAAEHGCEPRVRFLPYVSRADLIGLYAGAELTVYPTLVEGWGFPVVESLVLGTPVATSNTSALPEAGGDHAFYFAPDTAESIADGLAQAIERLPAWPALRAAAVARARTFTWRRTATEVLACYREVARR